MTAISVILLNIAAILGIWGFIWMLWDKRAMAPGLMLTASFVLAIVGALL